MVDFRFLHKGLCGLAQAHRAGPMAGHLGAAVTAGYFFGEEQPDLDPAVYAAVQKNLGRIIAGDESIWFNAKKVGVSIGDLFQPLPDGPADKKQLGTLADALAGNIDKTRQSGHNVIFTSIALRALHDHPQYATAPMLQGIARLIHQFDGAVPGRGYYGRERGWITGDKVELGPDDDIPRYTDHQAMAETVIDELIRFASVRRQGYGGLFHLINHTAGLCELATFGYRDLSKRGLAAHRQHIRLLHSLPDVEEELGPLRAADQTPWTPEYWSRTESVQWSAWLTHRIKTLYGFSIVLGQIEQPAKRKLAKEKFLYLMA